MKLFDMVLSWYYKCFWCSRALISYSSYMNVLPDIPMKVTPQMQLQIHPIKKQATRRSWSTPIPNTVQHDPHFSPKVMSSVFAQQNTQIEAAIEPTGDKIEFERWKMINHRRLIFIHFILSYFSITFWFHKWWWSMDWTISY